MSYDTKILRELIAREISNTVDEALGGAGSGIGGAGDTKMDFKAGGTTSYGERWGWSSHGEPELAVRAKGFLGLLGLPQSVPDAWNAWFGKEGVFGKIFSIVGKTGELFIDVLFNNITPSPKSARVESWTQNMFPNSARYIQNVNSATLAPGPASIPSLGPNANTTFNFSPHRFGESKIVENTFSQDPVASLDVDLEGILGWINRLKSSPTLSDAVDVWKEVIQTDGTTLELISAQEGVDGLDRVKEVFVNDIAIPFIKHVADTANIGLTNSSLVDDNQKSRLQGLLNTFRSTV